MKYGLLPIAAAAVLILTGCTGGADDPESRVGSPPSTVASSPTAVDSPSPSMSPAGGASESDAPSSSSPSASAITAPLTLYFVATGDGGVSGEEIGCGDSLVADYTEPVTFTDQLQVSMDRLLSNDEQFLGQSGLLNALYMSDLEFVSGSVEGDVVTVELSGEVVLGGVCDGPRVSGQLRQTAETAVGAGSSVVLVNGVRLEEIVSQK